MAEGLTVTNPRPLYQQVVDIMTRGIAEGLWKSGQMLPSEQKLAAQLGVSQGTVRKALDRLAAEQLVTRKQGLGTRVSVSTRKDMLYRFFKLVDASGDRFMPDCEQLRKKVVEASAYYRDLFDLRPKSRVVRFLRRRHENDHPIMIEWITLPLNRFKNIDRRKEMLPTTLYDFFESEFQLKVLRVTEKLSSINAGREDAELLGIAKGSALLVIERLAYSFDDVVIEHRISKLSTADHAYLSELT